MRYAYLQQSIDFTAKLEVMRQPYILCLTWNSGFSKLLKTGILDTKS
jgi:hypothetical protein